MKITSSLTPLAMTGVTGFGLAGHLLEICRGSRLGGASARDWNGYGDEVHLPDDASDWQRALVTDSQTRGGLLVACAPDTVAQGITLL